MPSAKPLVMTRPLLGQIGGEPVGGFPAQRTWDCGCRRWPVGAPADNPGRRGRTAAAAVGRFAATAADSGRRPSASKWLPECSSHARSCSTRRQSGSRKYSSAGVGQAQAGPFGPVGEQSLPRRAEMIEQPGEARPARRPAPATAPATRPGRRPAARHPGSGRGHPILQRMARSACITSA
jgi:hypothetical protein